MFPAACATGVLYVGMEVVFWFFFSGIVIPDAKKFGPSGTFTLLSYLIAVGVGVTLRAVSIPASRRLGIASGRRRSSSVYGQ